MTTKVFELPDLGEGLTEATIVRWLVAVGDSIKVDQAIAEVETAKSIVELPSPHAGTVAKLHWAEGDTVATGAAVIDIASEQTEAKPIELEAYREEERAGSGNVLIGYGTGAGVSRTRRRRRSANARGAHSHSATPRRTLAHAHAPSGAHAVSNTGPVAVRSPIVRRLAANLGVDLHTLTPSGEGGVITRQDVLHASSNGHAPSLNGHAPTMNGLTVRDTTPLTPMRKHIAAKLSQSRSEIPEATVWVDVDVTELWNLRQDMAAEGERAPSFTALLARFVLLALNNYPVLASRLSDDGNELISFDGVNLGIAVNTPRGLCVPVLPSAHELRLGELQRALAELSAGAQDGKLDPAKLSGSTFTLNNYGSLGVDGSAAIINHPEVAILGMGRIIERPWVVGGEIVPRRITQLSLVFDHRVCDGGEAAGFLREVAEHLEHPMRVYTQI